MKKIALVLACLLAYMPLLAWAQGSTPAVAAAIEELVAANRILAAQGILPGYGHISIRHPQNPNRYFISRSLAPELVTAGDIVELDLDSVPVSSSTPRLYLERFIHGEIYKIRPDINAVVHNHTPTVISFGIGSTPLKPVFHMAAFFLDGIPIWDYRDFGTANGALVDTPARGAGLAEALADRPVVLMRNHGVTVVGSTVPMVVGRSITLELNAEIQSQALARGDEIVYLEQDEESPGSAFDRSWDLWLRQLEAAQDD
ncbi:MAG: class II aldolase/adducin family protein [Gammaproteobacteria bacterium]|nr:class II aldolase/adducin family protein [Gammaproteobacteria bacterium]MDH3507240.1 class II aldolase/adducin family protein [Gammaproteobacteria bacterium]